MADLRFAAAGVKIATVFTRRGLVAEFGASWMLPRLVGTGNAMDLLLSGRAVTAEEALAMGLVNRVYPADELVPAAQAYACDLAVNCSPLAMQAVKAQVAADWTRGIDESQDEAFRLVKEPARRPDFREGVAAFTEKRPPDFPPLPPRCDQLTTPTGRAKLRKRDRPARGCDRRRDRRADDGRPPRSPARRRGRRRREGRDAADSATTSATS